jgi:GTP-binding protein HflX
MRFYSEAVEEHPEVPLADDGALDDLVAQFAAKRPGPSARPGACYVVSVRRGDEVRQRAALAEIVGLVDARGDQLAGSEQIVVSRPNPRTWFGKGTAEAIAERARAVGAEVLVLDVVLSPSQTRNLEELTGLAVQDREGVILGVFQKNARTRKANIQVSIAHLEYLRPRIRGIGLEMDQQAGGLVNGKGAGETASELLARQLDDRLVRLRRELDRLQHADDVQRRGRRACPRVALVGYTNAGKTSLMNALTGAGLSARDRPFETLDTTTRCLTRHGGDVLIGDTVGFIRELPERLLASFESTLTEIRDATVLALVVDLSDPEWPEHLRTTLAVVERLGAGEVRRLYVFHKADRVEVVPMDTMLAAAGSHPWAVTSCGDAASIDGLRDALLASARGDRRTATVVIPYAAGDRFAAVYAKCRVLSEEALDDGVRLVIEGPDRVVAALVTP